MLCDKPDSTEPTRKMTIAEMNRPLRPKRSPSLPPNNSRLPNDRVYAVMIHWRSSVEK
jgi:hypothetical protein